MKKPSRVKPEDKNGLHANASPERQRDGVTTFQFVDTRPQAIIQQNLQEKANNSPQVAQLQAIKDLAKAHSANQNDKTVLQRQVVTHSDELVANEPKLKTNGMHNRGVIQRCKKDPDCPNCDPCPEHDSVAYKRAMTRRRRGARENPTTLMGSGRSDEKSILAELKAGGEREKAVLAEYDRCMGVLTRVLNEPWASKRLKKLQLMDPGFKVKYDKNAGRGTTDPGVIKIGPEGLVNEEVCRICLRHEFDHAKLVWHDLKIAGFRVRYVPKRAGVKKGTFLYQLEELIVRLRDLEHQKGAKKDVFIFREESISRIHMAYAVLQEADRSGLPEDYVPDIFHKLDLIAKKLDITLT